MRAWITKYALTDGVFEVDGEATQSGCLRYKSGDYYSFVSGGDWHPTREQAVARAEDMRIRKLKSLDNQIKRVSSLRFD